MDFEKDGNVKHFVSFLQEDDSDGGRKYVGSTCHQCKVSMSSKSDLCLVFKMHQEALLL